MASPRKKERPEHKVSGEEIGEQGPVWLSEHAIEVWAQTIRDLKSSGRPLLSIHVQTLIGFCSACSDLKEAGEILAREGHLVDGGREGQKRHPAGSMRMQSLTAVRAYAAELGLTPTSASRLPPVEVKKEDNPFTKLMKK